MLRWAVVVFAGSLVATGCQDVRAFEGTWSGPRVGDEPVRTGFDDRVSATLTITDVDRDRLTGLLSTADGRFDGAAIAPIRGAEADVLSTATFEGSPRRVVFAFANAADGGGDATAVVALYDDDRVETRILRGGADPLYGIFDLSRID